jgi:hypothetical protein
VCESRDQVNIQSSGPGLPFGPGANELRDIQRLFEFEYFKSTPDFEFAKAIPRKQRPAKAGQKKIAAESRTKTGRAKMFDKNVSRFQFAVE